MYPMAPYLFLIVAKLLNSMVLKGTIEGRIKGIVLLGSRSQQVVAQFNNDTSFTLLGEELPVRNLLDTLGTFCSASRLVLNWAKSCGYWLDGTRRPTWTSQLGITWVDDNCNVSKLLGTSFRLNMRTQDVDEFLKNKLSKKLRFWSTAKINSTRRGVIVNSILLSTLI